MLSEWKNTWVLTKLRAFGITDPLLFFMVFMLKSFFSGLKKPFVNYNWVNFKTFPKVLSLFYCLLAFFHYLHALCSIINSIILKLFIRFLISCFQYVICFRSSCCSVVPASLPPNLLKHRFQLMICPKNRQWIPISKHLVWHSKPSKVNPLSDFDFLIIWPFATSASSLLGALSIPSRFFDFSHS